MLPTLWTCDVINDVMNAHLYKCSHNLMIPVHRKFYDNTFSSFLVIMKNVISFIKEYRGSILRPPCDVIDGVIIMKNIFGIIWDGLFISEVKLKLYLIFKNFKMAAILSSRQTFVTGSCTGSWIDQKDSHQHFRHFELLIDALAEILTEIYQFQNSTYIVTLWRHQLRHVCLKINLHN